MVLKLSLLLGHLAGLKISREKNTYYLLISGIFRKDRQGQGWDEVKIRFGISLEAADF